MNVMLIDPSSERGYRLQQELLARGFEIKASADAYYALSLSERTRLDVLFVSAQQVAGFDLLVSTFLEDRALAHTKLCVYDAGPRMMRRLPSVVLTCPKTTDERLIDWMAGHLGQSADLRAGVSSGGWDQLRSNGVAMIGTFEVTSFADLLQLVCSSNDAGTVLIRAPKGEAKILFRGGHVERVEYSVWRDVEATAWLLRDIEDEPATQFRRTWASEVVANPMTLKASGLLLEASVCLDENSSRQHRRCD